MRIEALDLVIELRKRNKKALYQLIDRYGGLIKGNIRRHVQPDVYDECMDDILLAIWNNIDKFHEDRNSFKNWVAAVSKYKAIDYQRKHYRVFKHHAFEDINTYYMVEMPQQRHDEISTEMEQLLAHLNQNDKDLLVKHYLHENSVEEIAEDMGVKRSWIYNRLSRARNKLRAVLIDKNKD